MGSSPNILRACEIYDICDRYLNRDDVQQALRVREGTVWEQCSTQVRYKTTDMLRPMMPYYQRLLNDYDIPILVFSGVRIATFVQAFGECFLTLKNLYCTRASVFALLARLDCSRQNARVRQALDEKRPDWFRDFEHEVATTSVVLLRSGTVSELMRGQYARCRVAVVIRMSLVL